MYYYLEESINFMVCYLDRMLLMREPNHLPAFENYYTTA